MNDYKWINKIPVYGDKIMRIVKTGLFMSPYYDVNDPEAVAQKIYTD